MPLLEALRLALAVHPGPPSCARSSRSSASSSPSAFLVAVVAIIQGMNAYVKENLTGAVIGTNAFQVRRDADHRGPAGRRRGPRRSPSGRSSRRTTPRRSGAPLPDAEAVSLPVGLAHPDQRRESTATRTVGDVLIFGVTPPYQLVQDYSFAAGEPLTDPDVDRAPAGGGARLRRGRQAVRRARSRPIGRKVRVAGREVHGQGRDRAEGPGAGPVVRRLRCCCPTQHLRVDLRPAQDHGGLGQDARCRRRSTAAMARARGGDAGGAPAPARRGRTTSRWTRPTRWWPSGRRLTQVLFTDDPRRGLHRHRGGRHRHHEHHADVGQRADPRDRHPQVARRHAPRHPPPVPGGGGHAVVPRRGPRACAAGWSLRAPGVRA